MKLPTMALFFAVATNGGKGGHRIFCPNFNATGINTYQGCLQNFSTILVELMKLELAACEVVRMALFFCRRVIATNGGKGGTKDLEFFAQTLKPLESIHAKGTYKIAAPFKSN
jgi:hypothetical protein